MRNGFVREESLKCSVIFFERSVLAGGCSVNALGPWKSYYQHDDTNVWRAMMEHCVLVNIVDHEISVVILNFETLSPSD